MARAGSGAGLTELSKRLDERRAGVERQSRESRGKQRDDTAPEESNASESPRAVRGAQELRGIQVTAA